MEERLHPDYGEIEAYRTGEAEPAMAAHISQCSECLAALEELKAVAELLRDEPPLPPLSEQRKQQLAAMVRDEGARVRRELGLWDMTGHPDNADLSMHLRGEADAAVAQHVEQCEECQIGLAEIAEIAALLKKELARAGGSPSPMPEHVDQKIRFEARRHAARVRRELRLAAMRRWAIAAAIVLSAGGLLIWRQMERGTPAAAPRVDIVDALIASYGSATAPVGASYDVNGDGRIDDDDVDGLARRAVIVGNV